MSVFALVLQIAELQAEVDKLMNLQLLQDELDSDELLSVLEESGLFSVEVGMALLSDVASQHIR